MWLRSDAHNGTRFLHVKVNCLICFFITESNQITTTCCPNSLKMSEMFTNMEYFKGAFRQWGHFSKIQEVKIINERST